MTAMATAPKGCLLEKFSAEFVNITKAPWTNADTPGQCYEGVTAGTDDILDLLRTPTAYRLCEST